MTHRARNLLIALLTVATLAAFSGQKSETSQGTALKEPEVGKPAPEFTVKDSNGKAHKLSDYRGKYVVLEWLNHGCPYVRKHYDSGNMQKTQAEVLKGGNAVWFSVVSSATGEQGHMTAEQANESVKREKAKVTAVLLDPEGTVGKAYGAKTTPHMYIIDPKGNLVYKGAIDSIRSTDKEDIGKATNYVLAAFTALKGNKSVDPASTEAYGCAIKYQN